MLVLVIHSVHMHAASALHEDSAPAHGSAATAMATALGPSAFVEHAGQIAGCMTLEFSAPRVLTLALAVAGFLALLIITVAAEQIAPGLGRVEIARPPPATRRQALLGVFLS
jgi:hypothetical protein